MTESKPNVLTPDTTERERLYREHIESGWLMVNRLRDFDEGQTIWGYVAINDESASMGKTHSRGDFTRSFVEDGHTPAGVWEAVKSKMERTLEKVGGDEKVGFAWVGKVERVRTEPRGPDPGEPPLKHAKIRDATIIESRYESG